KEVRLHADSTTKMDGNITAGDRIMATTSAIPGDAPYATNVYKFGSPNVIQGDVVRVDGNGYVVRDLNGREMRINTDSTTMRDGVENSRGRGGARMSEEPGAAGPGS